MARLHPKKKFFQNDSLKFHYQAIIKACNCISDALRNKPTFQLGHVDPKMVILPGLCLQH